MRLVLPGGAVLGGQSVACRPLAGVVEPSRPVVAPISQTTTGSQADTHVSIKGGDRQSSKIEPVPKPPRLKPGWLLAMVKLFLEVLVLFVGLINAILALFGLSRK